VAVAARDASNPVGGDTITVFFNETLASTIAPTSASFALLKTGDSFGTGATFAAAPSDATAVLITLGASPTLTIPGDFSPATPLAGPSGLDVAAGITSSEMSDLAGNAPAQRTPDPGVDIIPLGTVDVASAANPPNSDVPFVGEWPILHLTFDVNPNEPVDITSITLQHVGTPTVIGEVSQVRLYHDVNANGRCDSYADILLATGSYSGGNITLSSFTLVCTAGDTTHALIQHVMDGDENDPNSRTHQVTLDPATDVVACGHDTSEPITPGGAGITGPTMTVLRNTWVPVGASGLVSRYRHTAVSTGTDVIVWGGQGAGYYRNGAIYHPLENTWDATSTTGAPSVRRQHCAVWTGTKMLVWGGYDGATYLGDGGMYDPDADSWQAISSTNAPSSRMEAVAVWTGTEMIVWGGYSAGGIYLDTGGAYNPQTDTWTQTNTLSLPSDFGRRYFSGDWTGSGLIVWGGYNSVFQELDDGAIYNPVFNSWVLVSAAGAPEERRSHTGVWCANRFVVWGGYNGTNLYLDTGAYYLGGWWTDIDTGAPAARSEHTAVWCGKYMIAWGGRNAASALQTGGRWDRAVPEWHVDEVSTTGAPAGRRLHSATWVGAGMLVWGGTTTTGNSPTNTGARYLP
jgi:hypothetical protein